MALVSNSERLRNQVLEMRSSEFDVGMLDKSFRRAYELAPTAIPVSRKKKKKGLLSIYNTEEEPDDMSSRLPFIEESQKKEMDARQQQKLEARQWGNEFVIWRDDFDPGSNETLRETFVSRAKNTYMDVKKRSNNFKDHIVDNGMLRPEYNEVRAKTFEKVMLARNLQYDDIKKKSERRVEKTMADAGHRTCTPSRRRTGRAEGSTLAPQTSKERGERGGMVSIRPKEVKKSQNWKATPNFKHSALLVKHERRRSLEGILKPSGSLTRMGTKPVSPVSRIPSELSTSPQSYEAMYEEEDFVLHAPTPEVVVDVLESFKGKRKEIVEKGMKAQQDLSSSRAEVDAEIQRLKSIESVKKVSKREKVKQLTQSMRQPSPTPKESAESSDELRTPRGPPLLREPVYAEMTEENDGSLLTKGKTLRRPEREISIYVGEEEDQPEQGSEGSEEGSRVRTEEEERSLAVLRKFYPNNHIPAAKSSKPLFPFSADGEGGGGGKLEPALSPRMLTKSTLDSLPLRVPDGYMTTMMAEQEVEDEIEQMQETFYEKDASWLQNDNQALRASIESTLKTQIDLSRAGASFMSSSTDGLNQKLLADNNDEDDDEDLGLDSGPILYRTRVPKAEDARAHSDVAGKQDKEDDVKVEEDDRLDREGAGGDKDDVMLHATRDVLAEGEEGEAQREGKDIGFNDPLAERMVQIWEKLEMTSIERLEMIIKYAEVEYALVLEEALQAWEECADAILERERALNRLHPQQGELGKEDVKEEITRLNEQCQKSIDLLLAKFGDIPSYRCGART